MARGLDIKRQPPTLFLHHISLQLRSWVHAPQRLESLYRNNSITGASSESAYTLIIDRLPTELLIMVTDYIDPYNLLNLARCNRNLCERILHFFYKRVAGDESLYQSIIIFGGPKRQNVTISALEKAQKAGAPKFYVYLFGIDSKSQGLYFWRKSINQV